MSDLAAAGQGVPVQTAFRVLVVEDDPDMAAFLARMITQEGMAAEIVYDGAAAMAAVGDSPPDLLLLDVLLPGTSGFEVCRALKAHPATALIPIVLVTALEDQESRVRGIEAGADDFLHKPVRRQELLARVKTLRRLHETRRELEARRLAAEVEHKETMRRAFSRYVSPRLTDRIIGATASAAPFKTQAERADVVALFADLRGFTSIMETIGVANVVDMLNEYFSVLTEAAYQHEGTIFNMAGDSLLVGFNVPFAQPDAPARA
jgi:adenylate cyclase